MELRRDFPVEVAAALGNETEVLYFRENEREYGVRCYTFISILPFRKNFPLKGFGSYKISEPFDLDYMDGPNFF